MPMPKNSNDVISTITFQTLVCTAKLGVNIFQYFHDRMAQTNTLPSLATLIEERARDLPLAASWGEEVLEPPHRGAKTDQNRPLGACSRWSLSACMFEIAQPQAYPSLSQHHEFYLSPKF